MISKLQNIKARSLEQHLTLCLVLLIFPLLALIFVLTWYLSWSWWVMCVCGFFIAVYSLYFSNQIKAKSLQSYQRASLQLDAIIQEDYKLFAKALFSEGLVADFHLQLNGLSSQLQLQKSRYDQHIFLVYQLIGQLDAPILVFNAKQQLTFANDAFYQLKHQPWQDFRHASPEFIGLTKQEGRWCFHTNTSNTSQTDLSQIDLSQNREPERWQINQSEFIDADEQHLLLVFVDIQSALRASQLNAWQQIIRVLGHEIRNSLTPVSSMAESLADKTNNERDKRALNVITERCMHLQSFVERYASLSKQLSLHCQKVKVVDFFAPLIALYNDVQTNELTVQLQSQLDYIYGDSSFLSQVFINLLKNAQEAQATRVDIVIKSIQESKENMLIEVIDNGHGFSNMTNLFVPLYTTKEQGQGIGLSFCRNIIEQHQGSMNLVNNTSLQNNAHGVTVTIKLPVLT